VRLTVDALPFAGAAALSADMRVSVRSAPVAGQAAIAAVPCPCVPAAFAGSAELSSGLIRIFNWSQFLAEYGDRLIRFFYFTLTGGPDGTSDIEIPISSFQTRLRNGDPTYLSVVVPGREYIDAVNARPNGEMIIEMAYRVDGAVQYREPIVKVDLEDIRIDEGPTSTSVTLTGHRTESYSSRTVILQGVAYKSTIDGLIRVRASIDLFLRPGNTVVAGDDTFVCNLITCRVGENYQYMEIQEAA
jgi:hypothetical protein